MSEKSLAIIVAASPLALIVGVFVAPNDTGSLLGRMAAVLSDLVYLILLIIAGLTALRVNFLIVAAVTALVYTVLVALTNYDLNVRLGSFTRGSHRVATACASNSRSMENADRSETCRSSKRPLCSRVT